jgi:phage terminase Nu1 subunit (DNA packaging protein)
MTIGTKTIALGIRAAWPDSTGKEVARAMRRLGKEISLSYGRHIASTGTVPRRVRRSFLRLVHEAIARNEAEMAKLRQQLQEIDREEAARAVEAGDPRGVGPDAAAAERGGA